jgi:hypothetical protein
MREQLYFLVRAPVSSATLISLNLISGLVGARRHVAAFQHFRDIQTSRGQSADLAAGPASCGKKKKVTQLKMRAPMASKISRTG